jgi:hypothetical protein
MLEASDVKYVFDNRNQRTFEEADINTVISVLQRDSSGLGGETSFSAFYRPYESCVEPEIIGDIFQGTPAGTQYNLHFAGEQLDVSINDHFRDLTVGQADLWRLGGGEISQMGTLDGEKRRVPHRVAPTRTVNGDDSSVRRTSISKFSKKHKNS